MNKTVVTGQTVLYKLSKDQAKASGYDTLPATVLHVNADGSVNLQVHGADLYVEEIPHVSTVSEGGSTAETFELTK